MNDDLRNSLGFLLHNAARQLRKRFEARGAEYGLSSAQWRVLVFLIKGNISAQARLAELLEIEPISVSRLIDRMEEAGWVERHPDPADRRVRLLQPTAKARAVFDEVRTMAADVYDQAFAGMTEEQRTALIAGLQTICDNLSDDETVCNRMKKDTDSGS
ncbi:MarR family winged helix-turn-helix transcriptional regulator [Oricola thermophila]|nr:MarR family transcriptional regulator [Oricola thermophila]